MNAKIYPLPSLSLSLSLSLPLSQCMEAYQKKIGHYSQLEQHIHGAISRQLSEQEAQLKSACNTYPNFNNLFLLQREQWREGRGREGERGEGGREGGRGGRD